MSCFGGKTKQDPKALAIEQGIKDSQRAARKAMKILLLGTGDAGKSTFARQMAHMAKAVSPTQIQTYTGILRENCLGGAQLLIQAARSWKIQLPPELEGSLTLILDSEQLDPKAAEEIEKLAAHPMVQKLMAKRGDEIQFQGGVEGVKWYFSNASRFAKPDFIPSFEETLKARNKTSGVIETIFEVEGTQFTLVDVGGQRSERKKWLHCFSAVTAIIFLAAINEYDMLLEEDGNTNRLVESLKLWKALSSSDFFLKTPFILFLNKSDLFKIKMETVPLAMIFQDWETFVKQPSIAKLETFEQGWRFIAKQYENHFGGSSFYAHVTCALDTDSCRKVWESVRSEMVRKAVNETSLI